MTYYCPECGSIVERINGCGATGYFCDKCKKLISSKMVIEKSGDR